MEEEKLRANIARLTDCFVVATRLKQSTVLARAAKDARFLERTGQAGGSFTVRVYDKAVRWFSEHWPEGTPWPVEIVRPEAEPAPATSSGAAA